MQTTSNRRDATLTSVPQLVLKDITATLGRYLPYQLLFNFNYYNFSIICFFIQVIFTLREEPYQVPIYTYTFLFIFIHYIFLFKLSFKGYIGGPPSPLRLYYIVQKNFTIVIFTCFFRTKKLYYRDV